MMQSSSLTALKPRFIMEKYQKRMIEEFKELNERTTKLEHFLNAPEMEEKRAKLSEKMLSAMHCQYSGMVVYRSNLADRLIMLGLAEHVFEYPELKVGEEFETEDGKFRCIGHEENGCPVCEIIEADGQQEAMSHEDEVVAAITAALMAYYDAEQKIKYESNVSFVVRSIKKINR